MPVFAFSVTLPPVQKFVELAGIMAAAGYEFIITVVPDEVAEQLLLVTFTV